MSTNMTAGTRVAGPADPRMSLRRRDTSILAAAGIGVILSCGTARAADVPAAIAAEGKTVVLTLHAAGAQIYECKAAASGALTWQFREPLATLLQGGKTIGRHFAGPSWELADGSAVVGKVAAQAPGATANDITQLKLNVADRRGSGALTEVTTVQRLDTHGGVFSGTCDSVGALHVEPYSADYVFSKG